MYSLKYVFYRRNHYNILLLKNITDNTQRKDTGFFMRKLRNLCLLGIFIVLILLAGTKALLWYYTEKTVKDIQNTLPPGAFSYQSISTSLKGSISLNSVNLLIDGQNFKIEKIELTSNNIVGLLTLIAKNWGSKIPNELTLKIIGIKLDIGSLMANNQGAGFFNNPLSIPCGKITKLTVQDYQNMGYENFVFDLDMGYEKISNTRIKLNMNLNMRDALQVALFFYGNLSVINSTSKLNNRKATIPQFEINIKNNVLQEKLYGFCAKQENTSLTEYLKTLPPRFVRENIDQDTVSSAELSLSNNVIDGLNEYMKKPKDLYFSTDPKADITLNELKNMSEKSVLELIQPRLKVNGKNIPIAFEWMTTDSLIRKAKQGNPTRAPIIQSDERILTPISELNEKAFNKKIEIHTRSGAIYKGAFRKIEGNTLHIIIHKSWGTSDVTLKTDTILLVYILSDF